MKQFMRAQIELGMSFGFYKRRKKHNSLRNICDGQTRPYHQLTAYENICNVGLDLSTKFIPCGVNVIQKRHSMKILW